jgi:hypothetical protein
VCKKVHRPGHTHGESDAASRRVFLSSLISACALLPLAAYGQEKTKVGMAEQFRKMSEEYEQEGLAAPFRGITTDREVLPGLFQISPSGVSTEPVRDAAERFIASLDKVQLAKTMFPVDDV